MSQLPSCTKWIPNLCTLSNAVCGIIALSISAFYRNHIAINIACILIVVGGFFDYIDGKLARKWQVSSPMGKELDSFADLITFGIAPMFVFLALHSVGNDNPVTLPEIVISTFYISSAIYRLARYNVSDHSTYFLGLPSTASGMLMSLFIILSNIFRKHWAGHMEYTVFSYCLIVFLGVAMISTVKVNRILEDSHE